MYYTIKLTDHKKQLWNVVKYNDTRPGKNYPQLITDVYTYNKSETIKSSLSYKEASNLATILQKLTKGK